MATMYNALTDVPGIRVGHAQNLDALTGCTVVLCEEGAVGGVDQRGGAPGTRETDALRPMHTVDKAHAVILSGGSAYGLDAAGGVMRYLEEKGVGYDTGVARVPIVASAILFDLAIGSAQIRPDPAMGYLACQFATSPNVEMGNVGAGTGATVGKILGMSQAMKSGLGSASMEIGGGVIVAALIAVNSFGDVVDPTTSQILAGVRPLQIDPSTIGSGKHFGDTLQIMRTFTGRTMLGIAGVQNTVIGVVATNARLDKNEANKVAQMAHNGLALAIRPAHTMLDGDTIFCLATGKRRADTTIVGAFAAQVVASAIVQAIQAAEPAGGLPSYRSYVFPEK